MGKTHTAFSPIEKKTRSWRLSSRRARPDSAPSQTLPRFVVSPISHLKRRQRPPCQSLSGWQSPQAQTPQWPVTSESCSHGWASSQALRTQGPPKHAPCSVRAGSAAR